MKFLNMKRTERCIVFTLIELLIVIAIISILMAMLLPGLKGAKDIANEITCKGQLKQMATGQAMYADDFLGWTYGPASFGGGQTNTNLLIYHPDKIVQQGILAEYMNLKTKNAIRSFFCPRSKMADFETNATAWANRNTWSYCTYNCRGEWVGSAFTSAFRLSKMSKNVMLSDMMQGSDDQFKIKAHGPDNRFRYMLAWGDSHAGFYSDNDGYVYLRLMQYPGTGRVDAIFKQFDAKGN